MATTAKGTPYVESSDLVADYPSVSLALAEHIDDLPAAVLQVVRATDTTERSTTSTSFVDVTGMSVTITPQKSTSALIIAAIFNMQNTSTDRGQYRITDSSNNTISGAETIELNASNNPRWMVNAWGYATPATTSPVTYKLRFRVVIGGTTIMLNDVCTAQMFAIEVSA